MSQRMIDACKCTGCGLCVSDCITGYLILATDTSGKRAATFQERGRCIDCGHCNAICPQNAVTGGEITYGHDGEDNFLSLMETKRSVRKYLKGSVIPQQMLSRILFAGQTAPTAGNRKSSRIILVKELLPYLYNKVLDCLVTEVKKTGPINPLYAQVMRFNDTRDEILWNAEYLVLFVGSHQSVIDSSVSAERMQLEAHKLGVGSAYRGDMLKAINNTRELRDLLEIKKNEDVLVAFAMGITGLKYQRAAVKHNHKVIYK